MRPIYLMLVASGMAFGMPPLPAWAQKPGPISAATAKATGAQTVAQGYCMSACKARGKTRTRADCAKWCAKGRCYYSSRLEPYCVK
jgi:hypothetical protein